MYRGNRENRDYLSRRNLLLAIGEAGAAASVLDPDPSFMNGDPVHRFYQDENSMNASHNGVQEGHRCPEDDHRQGLPASEKRVMEKELSEGLEENQKEELELPRYDHAA